MSAYFKSRTFYSVRFPLAGLLLAVSLFLIHFLTDFTYNGVNDKIEVNDKSIMEPNLYNIDTLFLNYTMYYR